MENEVTFISEGTERHASGIKDSAGRDCGSTVLQGVQVEEGGTYLTAYVHANRDGKDFCKNGGSFRRFELTATNELSASSARSAWVTQAVASAKDRAAKRWAKYN